VKRGTGNDTKLFQSTQIVTHSSHPTTQPEFLSSRRKSDRRVRNNRPVGAMLRPRCDYALVYCNVGLISAGPGTGLVPTGAVCQRPAMGHVRRRVGPSAHDHARSRAYRLGEDAIGGYSDEGQRWCLGVALCANDGTARERLRVLSSINDRQPRMLY